MITQEELERYRELCARAPKGPWKEVCGTLKHYLHEGESWQIGVQELDPRDGSDVPAHGVLAFAAASRDMGPRLLAEVERLQILVEELRKQLRQT